MRRTTAARLLLFLLLSFLLPAGPGCQQTGQPEKEPGAASSPAAKSSPAKTAAAKTAGQSASAANRPDRKHNGKQTGKTAAPPKPPSTPDAAIVRVVNGIRAKRPEVLWDFLPGSYQRDINALVHLFGAKMDAELWDRTIRVGRRITALCRQRKSAMLNSSVFRSSDENAQRLLSAEWDAAVSLAETLLQSDLADVNRLQQFDGRRFLAATGGQLMHQLARFSQLLPGDTFNLELRELAQLRARVVSLQGETAVVELTLAGVDAEPQRVEFIRKEGKWIPRDMAAEWEASIASLRKKIEAELTPAVLRTKKKQMLAVLQKLEQSLDQLEKTAEDAEFSKRFAASPLAPVVRSFFRSALPAGETVPVVSPPGKGKTRPPQKKEAATSLTVIVQGRLNAAAAEKVADELFALGKFVDVGPFEIGEKSTRFPVVTRQSFDAFRKAIRFAEVVSADERKKEITLRLRSSQR